MPKAPFHSHRPGKEPRPGRCPPFEEAAAAYLEQETEKQRALRFARWLRDHHLAPAAGNNGYNWYVKFHYVDKNQRRDGAYYRGTYHGCYIKLFQDTWHLLPSKDILEQALRRPELKEALWAGIFPCFGCNYGCFRSTHGAESKIVIQGREFTGRGVCLRNPICLTHPDDQTLRVLQDILLERKNSPDLVIGENMNIYNYGMR